MAVINSWMLEVANLYPTRALLTYFGNMVQRDVKKKSSYGRLVWPIESDPKKKNQHFIIECVRGGGAPPVPRLTW